MKQDKCYITGATDKRADYYRVYLHPSTYREVRALGCQVGKTMQEIAEELLRFALDRVEIVDPTSDD
jgi:hypothetical protein